MNLTLKNETTKPAAFNYLQQQERFDEFIEVYNNERPHQALGGRYPGQAYTPSVRTYEPAREPVYPYHDKSDPLDPVRTYLHWQAQDQPESVVCQSNRRSQRGR